MGTSIRLPGAMLVQKSEHVIGPDGGSKIAKGMALLSGLAVSRVNLQLVRLARVFHRRRESVARRQVVIVRGLEKENRHIGVSNRTSHQRLQFGRLGPALGASRRIDCRAVSTSLRAQHALDAAERVSR